MKKRVRSFIVIIIILIACSGLQAGNGIYSSTELANTNYDELKRDWIYIVSHGVSLTEPSELSDIHIGADEYILNCTNDEVERCLLVALYKNDYVEFTIDMASLTYDDLARIIFELDSRMLSCNELE